MRLLIVEDEEELAETVRRAFVEDGFSVDVATDGESGLFNAQSWNYDAIVLDLMLPRMGGSVGVDSALGQGSRFHLDLPEAGAER